MRTLRPHQERGIRLIKESMKAGNSRVMMQAPTGFGKTLTAAHIIQSALDKGNRVIFCVNAISLIDQSVQDFYAEGIRNIGVLQGQHPMTNRSRRLQVCSVQTLQNRQLPDADLVLLDEAHNWFKFYGEWMTAWNAIPFIGLSATPWTKGLGQYYDDLVIPSTTSELIAEGWLSPFRVFAPTHPDLSDVRTQAGDYHEGDLGKAMDKKPLVADIVDTWRKRGEDRPTLCYAVNRAHTQHIQEEFQSAGIPCGYVDSFTKIEERRDIRDKFHSGEYKVVANVGCLTTGIDWDVRCLILARPTKSEMLFTQIVGRGLRTAPGKEDCLILDHSDTHERLGFVTDINRYELDDGKPKDKDSKEGDKQQQKENLPSPCPSCAAMKPAGVHQCPACGFAPKQKAGVDHVDGELKELETGTKTQRKNNRETPNEEKRRFYGELLHHARNNGKKDGWAAHKYKAKFGVWPDAHRDASPVEPRPETESWIKAQNIRYAKSKGNRRAG